MEFFGHFQNLKISLIFYKILKFIKGICGFAINSEKFNRYQFGSKNLAKIKICFSFS